VKATEDRGPKTEVDRARKDGPVRGETCDHCGAEALVWRKCKMICESCGNINKSCADL
jgi:hypothetical protein